MMRDGRTAHFHHRSDVDNTFFAVAQDPEDSVFKTFGLERITNLKITRKRYKHPNNFDAEEKFKYSFGIITNEIKPEKIKLWLSHEQANYIKTLPLHHSQKIIFEKLKSF